MLSIGLSPNPCQMKQGHILVVQCLVWAVSLTSERKEYIHLKLWDSVDIFLTIGGSQSVASI